MVGSSILDVLHLASPSRRGHTSRPLAVIDWSALPQDLLDHLVVSLWKVDAEAPRIAAVSTLFRHASRSAELALARVDVPVPRPYLRIGNNPSHEPLNDVVKNELAKVRAESGEKLELFEPFVVELPGHAHSVESDVVYKMTVRDATTILRAPSVVDSAPVLPATEGLLEAAHLDSYFRYLIPDPSNCGARCCGARG